MDDTDEVVITRMDAVKRFEFMKKAYDKVKGAGFVDSAGKEVLLCGAIALGEYVYVTNNHLIGKMHIPGHIPGGDIRYWDFKETDEMQSIKDLPRADNVTGRQDKEQANLFYDYVNDEVREFSTNEMEKVGADTKLLKQFFFSWRDNLIKIKKDLLLDELGKIFGRNENDRAKYSVVIKAEPESSSVSFKLLRLTSKPEEGEPKEFTMPMHIGRNRDAFSDYTAPGICSINCFYLYHILRSFQEYDIIDLAYNNDFHSPVIFKGHNPRVSWKPDIRFALCQSKPKYSYPEKSQY